MSNSIQIRDTDDLKFFGKYLAKSGLFDTGRDVAKAVTKIQMGHEMGLGPASSMANVHVVDGKPSAGAHIYASKVKQSDRYHYKVKEKNRKKCVLEWWGVSPIDGEWEKLGTSSFSFKEAKNIKRNGKTLASGDNWQNYPEDMCFARAITRGIRTFAPELTEAGAYVPDELGADNGKPVNEKAEEKVKEAVEQVQDVQEGDYEVVEEDSNDQEEKPSEDDSEDDESNEPDVDVTQHKAYKKFHAIGSSLYNVDWRNTSWDEKRKELVKAYTDGRTESSKELQVDELEDLVEKMENQQDKLEKLKNGYKANYKMAKSLAGMMHGVNGRQKHDVLIKKINEKLGVTEDTEDEEQESEETEEQPEQESDNDSEGTDEDFDNLEF